MVFTQYVSTILIEFPRASVVRYQKLTVAIEPGDTGGGAMQSDRTVKLFDTPMSRTR